MVASREPRMIAGFRYDEIIKAIDWNRVLIQACAIHYEKHDTSRHDVPCGSCIKEILLRTEEPKEDENYAEQLQKEIDRIVNAPVGIPSITMRGGAGDIETTANVDTPEWRLSRIEDILRSNKMHSSTCPIRFQQFMNQKGSVYWLPTAPCNCWLSDK